MLMRRVIRVLIFAVLVTLVVIASPVPVQGSGSNDRPGGATIAYLNEGNDGHVDFDGGDKVDWHKLVIPEPGILRMNLRVYALSADLDIALLDPDEDAYVRYAVSNNWLGDEEMEVIFTKAGTVYIKVYAYGSGDASYYTLYPRFQPRSNGYPWPDRNSGDNGRMAGARLLDAGERVTNNVDYSAGDRTDYWRFEPPAGSAFACARLVGETDLDLELLTSSGQVIARSEGPDAEERICVLNVFDTYFVKAYAYGENDGSDYVLMADAE